MADYPSVWDSYQIYEDKMRAMYDLIISNSGQLTNLSDMAQFITELIIKNEERDLSAPLFFNVIADMQSSQTMLANGIAICLGRQTINDSPMLVFQISNDPGLVPDSTNVFQLLDPLLKAVLVAHPEQYYYDLFVNFFNDTAYRDIQKMIDDSIRVHNNNNQAHPYLLGEVNNLKSKVSRLEAMLNTDITTNPFHVTFNTLDQVNVTGVWNQPLSRIEF